MAFDKPLGAKGEVWPDASGGGIMRGAGPRYRQPSWMGLKNRFSAKPPYPALSQKPPFGGMGYEQPKLAATGPAPMGRPGGNMWTGPQGAPPFGPPQPLDPQGGVGLPPFDPNQYPGIGNSWSAKPPFQPQGGGMGVDPAQFDPRPPQVDEFGRPINSDMAPFMRPYLKPEQYLQILMGMGGPQPNQMQPPPGTRPYFQ